MLAYPVSLPDGPVEDIPTGVTARVERGRLICPLPRPSFHGVALAEMLGLGDDFLAAWNAANQKGSPALAGEAGIDWWRYTRARPALRTGWPAADIHIPDLLFFADRTSGEVVRVLVWPETMSALIVPAAADAVVVRRERPGPPTGLVPAAHVVALMGDRAIRHELPVPHWLYRGGDRHRGILAEVAASGRRAKDYRAVRSDEVRDR